MQPTNKHTLPDANKIKYIFLSTAIYPQSSILLKGFPEWYDCALVWRPKEKRCEMTKDRGEKRKWEDYTELWSQLQIYYDLATDQGLQKADSKTELSMKDAS